MCICQHRIVFAWGSSQFWSQVYLPLISLAASGAEKTRFNTRLLSFAVLLPLIILLLLLVQPLQFDGIAPLELLLLPIGDGAVLLPLTAIACRCATLLRSAVSSGEHTLSYVSFFNWLLLMMMFDVFGLKLPVFVILFNCVSLDFIVGSSYFPLFASFSLFFWFKRLAEFCKEISWRKWMELVKIREYFVEISEN